MSYFSFFFFFSSRRRHTRLVSDWSSDVCSSDLLRNRRSRHRSNRMKIAELKPGMRRVDVKGKIVDVESPREVQTKFGPGQVASATLQDESGSVKVTLWNENISKVAVNDTIEIQNGYVDSFRGELQLNVGRYGKLAKVE